MSPTVVKRLSVTFDDGLPVGTRGVFTYHGQRWIAVPLDKHNAIVGIGDRALAMLARIRAQLTRWVSAHPDDSERVLMILQTIAAADDIELVCDQVKALTS